MKVEVRSAEYAEVAALRELYRAEAGCQLRRDSMLSRGLADPYLALADNRPVGYGAVLNKHDKGRLTEFYVVPSFRVAAALLFRDLLAVSGATHVEAQTNLPQMLFMLLDFTTNIRAENILFDDAFTSSIPCPGGVFRRAEPDDAARMFPHRDEPVGDWVIDAVGGIVATGGFLCHYNPPYGDIYMEVAEHARGRGYGSYLVQEVKRVCYEAGKRPAARCNADNTASRRTLEKAGLLPCARLLVGDVVSHR